MAHSFTVTALRRIGSEARRRRDPVLYLQQLAPIHVQWHMLSRMARSVGFLLFHWHVIQNLRRARASSLWGRSVSPFTLADFRGFGWPYDVSEVAQAGDADSLAAFSTEIERWHNDAHMAVASGIGNMDMMDPARNVFILEFWRLHYFIDARFVEQLDAYDGRGGIDAQVRRLQRRHHSDVSRI